MYYNITENHILSIEAPTALPARVPVVHRLLSVVCARHSVAQRVGVPAVQEFRV